ncbi:OmpH family outer membrane protein [Neotabrizicola sp. VNH66]|uniref:OmpH family outer membrane protein n=1 Tax=Neotabrizicola sp. VNH66 TaxID=3400918 RepID=UPI003C0C3716
MPARFGLVPCALALVLGSGAGAQEVPPPGPPLAAPAERPPASPVVTLSQERLFLESAWGKATMARIEVAKQALTDENREIEARLETEEQELTTRRATMAPAEFSKLADDFDARVERIRTEQDEKARELARQVDTDRGLFFDAALPVLADLMQELGAVAILSDGSVILSRSSVDVTDRAIQMVDARLTPPAPESGNQTGETPEPAPATP